MSKADTIDGYFAGLGAYSHVPYEPLGAVILEEARAVSGVGVPVTCALIEHESHGKNVVGCDRGSIMCHRPVDAQIVSDLLMFISYGGPSNGIGVTQLTYPTYIREANAMGGAHLVRFQIRRALAILAGYVAQADIRWALGAYNGGPGNPQYAYADAVLVKRDEWRRRLSL